MTVVQRRVLNSGAKARSTARPLPRSGPREPYGPGSESEGAETFDVELNLIAAITKYDGLEAVQTAGITEADFVDPEWEKVFREVIRYNAAYGSVPSWYILATNTGMPRQRPSTPGPLDYYLDRFVLKLRYDRLQHGVAGLVDDVVAMDVDAAEASLTRLVESLRDEGHGRSALDGMLRGSDLLAAPQQPLEWLVRGVWPAGSYGMVGAPEKSLKSYITSEMALAVASGTPFLGKFGVPEARPVLIYAGEGGKRLLESRLQALAQGMGIEPRDITDNLFIDYTSGPLDNDRALGLLERRVRETDPGLVLIDPWYKFHGGTTNGANLYEQGAFLSDIAAATGDAAAILVHHFNQTGPKTMDLKRLALSGGAEWSDSWMLIKKLQEDVGEGCFLLELDIGSRQWGGRSLMVDAQIGRIDDDTHQVVGDVSLRALDALEAGALELGDALDPAASMRANVIRLLRDNPWRFGKTDVVEQLGVNKKRCLQAVNDLIDAGQVETKPDPESSRRTLLAVVS